MNDLRKSVIVVAFMKLIGQFKVMSTADAVCNKVPKGQKHSEPK